MVLLVWDFDSELLHLFLKLTPSLVRENPLVELVLDLRFRDREEHIPELRKHEVSEYCKLGEKLMLLVRTGVI